MISADELKAEELRLRYVELLERDDVFPTLANWQYITAHAMPGLSSLLFRKYMASLTVDDNDRQELHDIALQAFPEYLSVIDRSEAIEALYPNIALAPDNIADLICRASLFDADSLCRMLEEGYTDIALKIIDTYQPEYSASDVAPMERLLTAIDNLPRKGYIENKAGIFGISEKYICPVGHSNPGDAEYCRHSGCGKNARGLTEKQEDTVANYSRRVSALKNLLG